MLVTRPEPDASDTAARLAALGIEPVVAPLLVHESLPAALPNAGTIGAIALTSANALRALEERGAIARYLRVPVYTVGDRTANLAARMGFVMVTSAGGEFADLAELLAHVPIEGPVLYPSGREVSADLGRSLQPFGRTVVTVPVYAMNAVSGLPEDVAGQLKRGEVGAALFYSRRTAETFVRVCEPVLDREARTQLTVLCMSEAVAAPLVDAHFVRVGLAERPDEAAMMGLALSMARDHNA